MKVRGKILTIKDLFTDNERLTFLVGAGCSGDPPSCLPAGRKMIEAIINYTCAESEIQKILELKELRFEQLVEIVRDNLDPELKIIDYYGLCDKPNLQHFFLADMIKKGHFVITTNFDFLIEYALLQSNIPKDEIIPVITKYDFAKFNNPINLFEKGKKSIYKIHGSTKNIITDESTRDSLVATIQAFGSNKEGENVFQVEPFKRRLFYNISNNRTLVVIGYSGSDDFDIIPTLMVLKNLKDIIWINFILDDGGSEEIFEISKSTVELIEKSNKVNQILAKIYRMHNTEHIYRVDVNTTRLIGTIIGSKQKLSSEMFSISPMNWFKENIKVQSEIIQYAIPYRIYSDFAMYQDSMRCSEKMLKIAEKIKDQSWKSIALYNIGKIYYAQGNYPEALKRCEEALTIDEQLGVPWKKNSRLGQIGLIYQAQGKTQKALAMYESVAALPIQHCSLSERSICLKHIGAIYHTKGELDFATEQFEEAIRIDEQLGDLSGKATSLNTIGLIYQTKGDDLEALKRFEEALRIHEQLGDLSGKATSLDRIAGIHYTQGNYVDALEKNKEALEILIKLGANKTTRAKLFKINIEETTSTQTAKSEITKIINSLDLLTFEDLDKIILRKFEEFSVRIPRVGWRQGKSLFRKYRDPKLIIPIIIYIYFRIYGYKITKSELLAVSHISSADFNNFLMQLKNSLIRRNLDPYLKALKSHEKALAIDPKDKKAWYNKGNTLLNLERYMKALKSYEKAIVIDPNYKGAWHNKGVTLFDLRRYTEALESFDKALAIDPNFTSAWYNKACIESLQNNRDKALEYLRKAINLDYKFKGIAKGDSDFNNIRDSQEFKDLTES